MSAATPATETAQRGGAHLRLLSDERLVRLASAGDRRAFAAIHQRHSNALYRYCLTIVRDPEDASDALQSAMMKALAALDRSAPDAPLRPWLFRIVHNEAVSLLRRRRPEGELSDETPSLGADVEATVAGRERLQTLVHDLQALPERQRSALVMRELSGLSHAEIGAVLELEAPQVKQAILEARMSLLESEKGREMDCAEVRALISERDGRRLRGRAVRAHLRTCDDCRMLRDAIDRRKADLAILAPPLPAGMLAGLLGGLFGGGGAGGIGGGGGGLVAKVAVGAAVVGGAGGGGYAIKEAVKDAPPSKRAPAEVREQQRAAEELPEATPDPVAAVATEGPGSEGTRGRRGSERGEGRAEPRAQGRDHRPEDRPRRSPNARPAPAALDPTATATPVATLTPVPGASNHERPERPVRTPRPEKTPKPVRTPKPERTPKPVRTPKPQKTPVATPTPRPTPSPKPTRTPPPKSSPDRKK